MTVASDNRCSPYSPDDYACRQSVEGNIVGGLGGIYSPYTCETFESTRDTDIEHIMARSEAHDSGLCVALLHGPEQIADLPVLCQNSVIPRPTPSRQNR